jgi:hypothetical protein
LEDEQHEREIQHERKINLRSDLEKANNAMISNKLYLAEKEKEEELKIKA